MLRVAGMTGRMITTAVAAMMMVGTIIMEAMMIEGRLSGPDKPDRGIAF